MNVRPIVITAPSSPGNKLCPAGYEPGSNPQMLGGLFRMQDHKQTSEAPVHSPRDFEVTQPSASAIPRITAHPMKMQEPALPALWSTSRKIVLAGYS